MVCCCAKRDGVGGLAATGARDDEELVLKVARFDADEVSARMDGVLQAAQAVAQGKGYAPEARLSGRVAGAGGTGEPHGPLSRLDAPAKCVLCELTQSLSAEPGYSFLRYTKGDTLLTEFSCGECKLPMHRSCAWYWHQRKSPYSRHVLGAAERNPTRLWPISEDALPAFLREGRLLRTGDPGEQGAVRMASELAGPWGVRERMYAVSGARFEHEIVKAEGAGECMLCKLTQRAWPAEGGGGEKKTKSTLYRCMKCGVHLHMGCFNVWHEERVQYSRIVWRARAGAGGGMLTQAQAARMYAATNPGSGAQNAEGRLSHVPHKLVTLGARKENCKLCELSAQVAAVDINRLEQTGAACETCWVSLHRDCAKLWHSAIAPYSQRVFGKAGEARARSVGSVEK